MYNFFASSREQFSPHSEFQKCHFTLLDSRMSRLSSSYSDSSSQDSVVVPSAGSPYYVLHIQHHQTSLTSFSTILHGTQHFRIYFQKNHAFQADFCPISLTGCQVTAKRNQKEKEIEPNRRKKNLFSTSSLLWTIFFFFTLSNIINASSLFILELI